MNITKTLLVTGLLAFAVTGANANVSIAAGLPEISYSASHIYETNSSQSAFNGGVWNAGRQGTEWLQVDLGSSLSISLVKFKAHQTPDGTTFHDIYISNSYIGDLWTGLSSVANRSGYTTNGTELSLQLGNAQGRFLQIVANNGPSWTAIEDVSVSAVPEPSAYAMLSVGAVMLIMLSARRRKVA